MLEHSITKVLAEFVTNTKYHDFPEEVILKAKDCLLDWFGCALAGSKEESISLIKEAILELGEGEHATLIGFGGKTNVLNAAMINGASGNLLDLDDVFPGMIGHPSSPLWPALLAISEWKGLSGKELLTAFILGYEIEARIGASIQPEHYELGWHATGTLGHFAAASGSGKLLNLTADKMVFAFALAGTQASGLRELFGTPSKSIHHGRAAADGITAALLAKKGLESTKTILEGRYGFPRAFGSEINKSVLLDGLGSKFCIMNTAFKRHAACGSIHSTIDGILELVEKHPIDINEIEEIHLTVHSLAADLSDNPQPKTGLEGKYSLQYCAAVTLVERKASLEQFSDDRLKDPLISQLMQKVTIAVDPNYRYIEAMPAHISIKTKKNEYTCYNETPKGRPSNPFTVEDKQNKFHDLSKNRLSKERMELVIKIIKNMEECDNVAEFMRIEYF